MTFTQQQKFLSTYKKYYSLCYQIPDFKFSGQHFYSSNFIFRNFQFSIKNIHVSNTFKHGRVYVLNNLKYEYSKTQKMPFSFRYFLSSNSFRIRNPFCSYFYYQKWNHKFSIMIQNFIIPINETHFTILTKRQRFISNSLKGILLVNFPEKEKNFLIKNLAAENKIALITQSASLLLKDSRNMDDLLGVDDPIQILFDKVKTCIPCICFINNLDSIGKQRHEQEQKSLHYLNNSISLLLHQPFTNNPSFNSMNEKQNFDLSTTALDNEASIVNHDFKDMTILKNFKKFQIASFKNVQSSNQKIVKYLTWFNQYSNKNQPKLFRPFLNLLIKLSMGSEDFMYTNANKQSFLQFSIGKTIPYVINYTSIFNKLICHRYFVKKMPYLQDNTLNEKYNTYQKNETFKPWPSIFRHSSSIPNMIWNKKPYYVLKKILKKKPILFSGFACRFTLSEAMGWNPTKQKFFIAPQIQFNYLSLTKNQVSRLKYLEKNWLFLQKSSLFSLDISQSNIVSKINNGYYHRLPSWLFKNNSFLKHKISVSKIKLFNSFYLGSHPIASLGVKRQAELDKKKEKNILTSLQPGVNLLLLQMAFCQTLSNKTNPIFAKTDYKIIDPKTNFENFDPISKIPLLKNSLIKSNNTKRFENKLKSISKTNTNNILLSKKKLGFKDLGKIDSHKKKFYRKFLDSSKQNFSFEGSFFSKNFEKTNLSMLKNMSVNTEFQKPTPYELVSKKEPDKDNSLKITETEIIKRTALLKFLQILDGFHTTNGKKKSVSFLDLNIFRLASQTKNKFMFGNAHPKMKANQNDFQYGITKLLEKFNMSKMALAFPFLKWKSYVCLYPSYKQTWTNGFINKPIRSKNLFKGNLVKNEDLSPKLKNNDQLSCLIKNFLALQFLKKESQKDSNAIVMNLIQNNIWFPKINIFKKIKKTKYSLYSTIMLSKPKNNPLGHSLQKKTFQSFTFATKIPKWELYLKNQPSLKSLNLLCVWPSYIEDILGPLNINDSASYLLPEYFQLLGHSPKLKKQGITLIASTNNLATLDAALLRPGRFDTIINFSHSFSSIYKSYRMLKHSPSLIQNNQFSLSVGYPIDKLTPSTFFVNLSLKEVPFNMFLDRSLNSFWSPFFQKTPFFLKPSLKHPYLKYFFGPPSSTRIFYVRKHGRVTLLYSQKGNACEKGTLKTRPRSIFVNTKGQNLLKGSQNENKHRTRSCFIRNKIRVLKRKEFLKEELNNIFKRGLLKNEYLSKKSSIGNLPINQLIRGIDRKKKSTNFYVWSFKVDKQSMAQFDLRNGDQLKIDHQFYPQITILDIQNQSIPIKTFIDVSVFIQYKLWWNFNKGKLSWFRLYQNGLIEKPKTRVSDSENFKIFKPNIYGIVLILKFPIQKIRDLTYIFIGILRMICFKFFYTFFHFFIIFKTKLIDIQAKGSFVKLSEKQALPLKYSEEKWLSSKKSSTFLSKSSQLISNNNSNINKTRFKTESFINSGSACRFTPDEAMGWNPSFNSINALGREVLVARLVTLGLPKKLSLLNDFLDQNYISNKEAWRLSNYKNKTTKNFISNFHIENNNMFLKINRRLLFCIGDFDYKIYSEDNSQILLTKTKPWTKKQHFSSQSHKNQTRKVLISQLVKKLTFLASFVDKHIKKKRVRVLNMESVKNTDTKRGFIENKKSEFNYFAQSDSACRFTPDEAMEWKPNDIATAFLDPFSKIWKDSGKAIFVKNVNINNFMLTKYNEIYKLKKIKLKKQSFFNLHPFTSFMLKQWSEATKSNKLKRHLKISLVNICLPWKNEIYNTNEFVSSELSNMQANFRNYDLKYSKNQNSWSSNLHIESLFTKIYHNLYSAALLMPIPTSLLEKESFKILATNSFFSTYESYVFRKLSTNFSLNIIGLQIDPSLINLKKGITNAFFNYKTLPTCKNKIFNIHLLQKRNQLKKIPRKTIISHTYDNFQTSCKFKYFNVIDSPSTNIPLLYPQKKNAPVFSNIKNTGALRKPHVCLYPPYKQAWANEFINKLIRPFKTKEFEMNNNIILLKNLVSNEKEEHNFIETRESFFQNYKMCRLDISFFVLIFYTMFFEKIQHKKITLNTIKIFMPYRSLIFSYFLLSQTDTYNFSCKNFEILIYNKFKNFLVDL